MSGAPTTARATPAWDRWARIGLLVGAVGLGLLAAVLIVDLRSGGWPADADVYLAAGQRLDAGHLLYALGPSDRVPAGSVGDMPLLSPPLIAVIWRSLAPFGSLAVLAWTVAAGGTVIFTTFVLLRAHDRVALAGPLVFLLILPLEAQLVSGNMNGFVLAGLVAVWAFATRGQAARAGLSCGVLVVAKVVPLPIACWLVVVVGRRSLVGLGIGMCTALALTLIGAGPGSMLSYVDIAREVSGTHAVGPGDWSLIGIAQGVFGASCNVAWWLPPIMLAAGLISIVALHERPAASFRVAVVTAVFGFAAVHLHTLALLLATAAPGAWWIHSDVPPGRRST